MVNCRLHNYAQTNIQLYGQLLAAGYSKEELRRIRDTYALAAVLFSGRVQPSGKTFISHVVGTASILASLGSNSELICAALLHNVYKNGEFGNRKPGVSHRKRREMKSVVGDAVEGYLAAFVGLPWRRKQIASMGNKLDTLDAFERGALLIRAADQLEKLLDLEVLYYAQGHSRQCLANALVYEEISKKLGVPELGAEIEKFLKLCQSSKIPSALCRESNNNVSTGIVVPRSYRLKICRLVADQASAWLRASPSIAVNRLKWLYWTSVRSLKRQARVVRRRWLVSRRGCLEINSKQFATLFPVDARLECVATGFQFTEGPVWIAEEGCLLFSDIPANRIYKLTGGRVSVFRDPSGNSNGLTRDLQGRLIACEHSNRRVIRSEKNGTITVLADQYRGKRLNSPNDVVVKADGTIYFTDPACGIKPEEQEQPIEGVYRLAPDRKDLALVVADFVRPNGLAFSPDEGKLYVDDSKRRHLRVFDVHDDGSLSNGRVAHDMNIDIPGAPDGMKVDAQGNIYCTGAGGVWVFNPKGKHLGTIVTPERPSNCAWGGEDRRSLYITAGTSVYKIQVAVPGCLLTRLESQSPEQETISDQRESELTMNLRGFTPIDRGDTV